MILIFAVDKNYSIGYQGDMLFHLRKDLARFKKITLGNILVMGRKTLESLPNSEPLPGRYSIVLTRDKNYEKDGVTIIHDLKDLDKAIKKIDLQKKKKVFVIGGGNLVDQVYQDCDYAIITEVDKEFDKFDTSIPNISEDDEWILMSESDTYEDQGLRYVFKEYQRKNSF